MNDHGAVLRRFYEAYRPAELEAMADPDRFFAEQGEWMASAITDTEHLYKRGDLDPDDFLAVVGDNNRARLAAQEEVYAEFMPLPEG